MSRFPYGCYFMTLPLENEGVSQVNAYQHKVVAGHHPCWTSQVLTMETETSLWKLEGAVHLWYCLF